VLELLQEQQVQLVPEQLVEPEQQVLQQLVLLVLQQLEEWLLVRYW
jgi:hypothetical protein